MHRMLMAGVLGSALGTVSAYADQLSLSPDNQAPVRVASAQSNLGGGFLEFLMTGGNQSAPARQANYPAQTQYSPPAQKGGTRYPMEPRYQRQLGDYGGREPPGTPSVDTPNKVLLPVPGEGKALRY